MRPDTPAPLAAAAVDFVLEGLYAQKKIARSEEWQYQATEQPRRPARPAPDPMERELPLPGSSKKKYYN